MSLEQSIDNVALGLNAIAAAINNLASAMSGQRIGAVGQVAPPEAANEGNVQTRKTPGTKPQKEDPAAATKPAATPPTATDPATAPAPKDETSAAAPASEIDFVAQIQKPIVAMAGAGRRDVALSILKKFGAAKASEIKPADWAAAAAAIVAANDAALAENA